MSPSEPEAPALAAPPGRTHDWAGAVATLVLTVVLLFVITRRAPYFFLADDNAGEVLPCYALNYRSLSEHGELAFYNWYQYLGQPHLGSGQTSVLYPPVYLAGFLAQRVFGDFRLVVDILVWMHLLGGALGLYCFLRQRGVEPSLAALAGALGPTMPFVVFISCMWVWVTFAFCWLPWQFLVLERLQRMPTLGNAFICAGVRAAFVLQGNMQWVLYVAMAEALWLASSLVVERRLSSRLILLWLFTLPSAAVFTLPLLHETLQVTLESSRGEALAAAVRLSCNIPPGDFFAAQIGRFDVSTFFSLDSRLAFMGWMFIGLFACLLLGRKALGRLAPSLTLLLATLLVVWGWLPWLYELPVFSHFRWPFKWLLLAGFAAVVLTATALAEARSRRRLTGPVAGALLVLAVASNIWVILSGTPEAHLRRKRVLLPDPALRREVSNDGRVLSLRPSDQDDLTGPFCFDYPTLFEWFALGGYDPVVPRRNAFEAMGVGMNGFLIAPLSREWLDHFATQSVRYLLAPSDADAAALRDPALGLREAKQTTQGTLFINDRARPIAELVDRTGIGVPLAIRVEGNRLVTALNGNPGTLVLAFLNDPRLEQRVDAGPWHPVGTSGDTLLIPVTGRTRQLELRYRPSWFMLNCGIAAFAIVAATGFVVWERRITRSLRPGADAARPPANKM